MMVTNKGGGLGRAVVGSVGLVRGEEKRREKRRYMLAVVSKLKASHQPLDIKICKKLASLTKVAVLLPRVQKQYSRPPRKPPLAMYIYPTCFRL